MRVPEPADELREAAERIARAAEALRPDGAIPPSGWQSPRPADDGGRLTADLQAVASLLQVAADAGRAAIPRELARQLSDAIRELLLALRALIDWWLERLERPAVAPVEVQDIPIV